MGYINSPNTGCMAVYRLRGYLLSGRGKIGAVSAAYLAARRHGGPYIHFRANPRGNDGSRGRIPAWPGLPNVQRRGVNYFSGYRVFYRVYGRNDRADAKRPETNSGLLDDIAAWIYGDGNGYWRLCFFIVSFSYPCLF